MVTATFRFYEELNDFLAPARRKQEFTVPCARAATTKHMIEALGVPHTEVELILVNGESADFSRQLQDGDRVAVYPRFEALDVTPLLAGARNAPCGRRVSSPMPISAGSPICCACSASTRLYDNHFQDDAIVEIGARDGRIVLTRDRALLKRRAVTHGCYVHALKSEVQLREIVGRLDLASQRAPAEPVPALQCAAARGRQGRCAGPPAAAGCRRAMSDSAPATVCGRVFWEGSHWHSMQRVLQDRAVQRSINRRKQ
jgi:uncharacterized protein